MDLAFTYAEKTKLETEADYPYAEVDQTCAYSASKGVVSVTSFVDVPANSTI